MGRRGVKISTEIREAFLANQSPSRRNDSLAAQGENTRLRRRMGISREPRVAWLAAVVGGPQPPRPPPCAFVPSCSSLPFPYKRLLAASLPLPSPHREGGRGVPCGKAPLGPGCLRGTSPLRWPREPASVALGAFKPPKRAGAALVSGGDIAQGGPTGTQLRSPPLHPARDHRTPPPQTSLEGLQAGGLQVVSPPSPGQAFWGAKRTLCASSEC